MQLYSTNKAEVLELVVTFTHNAVLLAKATVLSSYYRDIALTSVQQQLPTLLGDAVKQATDSQDYALVLYLRKLLQAVCTPWLQTVRTRLRHQSTACDNIYDVLTCLLMLSQCLHCYHSEPWTCQGTSCPLVVHALRLGQL